MTLCTSTRWSADVSVLTRTLSRGETLLITNRDIYKTPRLHGEDFYIYELMKKLKANGVSMDVAAISKHLVRLYSRTETICVRSLDSISKKYDTIILFNVSPFKILKARFESKTRIIMPIIYLWNKSSSFITNVKQLVGDTLWQIMVDEYVATSTEIAQGLRRRGVFKRVYLIPPIYVCAYCNFQRNIEKLGNLKKGLPQKVKAVYLGWLDSKRFSLSEVIDNFGLDKQRSYELEIYTGSPIEKIAETPNNVRVNIFRKVLSDEEKCKVLSESHLLIAPKCGTTMEPSITVMEAEYHGNIVVRT